MGKTVAEKVLAQKSGQGSVKPGDVVFADVDVVMMHEAGTFGAQRHLREMGAAGLAENIEIVVLLDHYVPANTVANAQRHKVTREFVRKMGASSWYEVGRGGICHQVLPEKGHVRPGEFIVGTDAHVTTYGALGAYAVGVGFTDMAIILGTGKMWVVVPGSVKVVLKGRLGVGVSCKDVVLKLLREFGLSRLDYKSLEIEGPAVSEFPVDGRMTICNMASEMGVKAVVMNPDRQSSDYVRERTRKLFHEVWAEADASYEEVREIDVGSLEPLVAKPSTPDNVGPVREAAGTRIDQAFLGSCTNGRITDLRIAAKILGTREVHPDVRLIITPASQEVYLQALDEGLIRQFITAGAVVTNATCGACIGGHMGLLADGEVCIASSNRNFVGRMGSPKSQVYLASPETVAASAISGHIEDPRKYL